MDGKHSGPDIGSVWINLDRFRSGPTSRGGSYQGASVGIAFVDVDIEIVVGIRPTNRDLCFLADPIGRRAGESQQKTVAVQSLDARIFAFFGRAAYSRAIPRYVRATGSKCAVRWIC